MVVAEQHAQQRYVYAFPDHAVVDFTGQSVHQPPEIII